MIIAANFENFLISPDFPIHFRKIHQISKNYLKSSESYGQKPLGGVPKDSPNLNRVKSVVPYKHRFTMAAMIYGSNMSDRY